MRDVTVERIDVRAYRIPTDHQEADLTLAWDSTSMVLVTARAGGSQRVGYCYTDASAAQLIETLRLLATFMSAPHRLPVLGYRR
jgi:hypothetical protein